MPQLKMSPQEFSLVDIDSITENVGIEKVFVIVDILLVCKTNIT